jgi:pimeloyl-ACP methyl ester carboxylesterase
MHIPEFTRRHFMAFTLAVVVGTPATDTMAASFASDRITVRTEGSGPDVVLIPGLNSSPRAWASTVAAVPGYRYHLVQLSGFAGQPAGANGTGAVIPPVAEEIARYIKETGLQRPAIVGHSLGGTLGIMIAERHPDVLSRLMVVDMLPYLGLGIAGPNASPEAVRAMADRMTAGAASATPEQRRQRSVATIDGMVKNAAMRPVGLEDSLASDPEVSARVYREIIMTDLRPELGNIAVPVTVLFARPQVTGKAWFDPVQQLTIKGIPDSAHFIMWDQPARFQAELKAFLIGDPGSVQALQASAARGQE